MSIKKLSKIAVKIDEEYTRTNPLCTIKKRRLLKRAIMIEYKLLKEFSENMILSSQKEIKDAIRKQLTWMQNRMDKRIGRKIQRRAAWKL